MVLLFFFFFQAEDGIRDGRVTGVQTCALPIYCGTIPEGNGWEKPERRNGRDGGRHQHATTFSGICRGLDTSRPRAAILDSFEGHWTFSGRLSWEFSASSRGSADSDALEFHTRGTHKFVSSPTRGGLCGSRAAASGHCMV